MQESVACFMFGVIDYLDFLYLELWDVKGYLSGTCTTLNTHLTTRIVAFLSNTILAVVVKEYSKQFNTAN